MPRVNEKLVVGTADILEALKDVQVKVAVNANRRALRKAAVVIQNEARRLVPVRTGALRKSIKATTQREYNDRKAPYAGYVRIDRKAYTASISKQGKLKLKAEPFTGSSEGLIYPRNYAHLVEFGTKPHSLRSKKHGDSDSRPARMHPGSRPRPFMRPALDNKRAEAIEVYRREMLAEVEKIKAKKRGKR